MIKKNDEFIVDIIDQGMDGEGIAKIEDFTIFINGAIKDEKIKIVITKVLTSFAYGKILQIIKKSKHRNDIDCTTYKKCGGCNLRHIEYKQTLEIKTNVVKNCLYKALGYTPRVNDCIGMEFPFFYRNKLQYPVGIDKNGLPIIGIYAERTHEIISTSNCLIQDKLSQEIANDIFEFIKNNNIKPYNEKDQSGVVRHIIIRRGKKTDEIMVIIVTNNKKMDKSEMLVKFLVSKFENIKTIVQNINLKNTNVILGNEINVLYGKGYIEDYLGEYKFRISPFSFYQVNPVQTEVLYNKAIEYAELTGKETVFDLYCGIGTIGIFAAKMSNKIIGIEEIEQAIENAKQNALINKIENSKFIVGKVEEIIPELIKREEADVVFIDPPRKGCEEKVLKTLLDVKPKEIVYISCNPATLARDVAILQEKYELKEVQPVDMFPYTSHVECCSVLKLR